MIAASILGPTVREALAVNEPERLAPLVISGFEDAPLAPTENWQSYPIRGSAQGSVSIAAEGRSGKALLIHTVEAMDGWIQASAAIPGGIVAGQDYELRVWLRGDRLIHNAALVIHSDEHWYPTDLVSTGLEVGNAWSECVLRFRASVTNPRARLGLRLVQEGRLWVDDLALWPVRYPPAPPEESGPRNLVRNGSFETGLTGWAPEANNGAIEELPDAPHGQRAYRLAPFNGGRLNTWLMAADAGRPATLSLMLKARSPARLQVLLRSGYAALAPPGPETTSNGPETIVLNHSIEVGTEWQPLIRTVELPPVPSGSYYLTLVPSANSTLWLDAVQFETSSAARPFRPKADCEGTLELHEPGATYRAGSPVTGTLSVWNDTQEASSWSCPVRIYDVWDRVQSELLLQIQAPPGLSRHPLPPIALTATGAFRIEVLSPAGPLLAEAVFAVLPPPDASAGLNAAIGTHVDFAPPDRLAQAGAKWTKSWWLSWDHVEPEPGVWRFSQDREIAAWRAAGLDILAVLGGPPVREQVRPENALSWGWYPPQDPGKLRAYARRVVERHRDRIHAWEMTNEPNSGLHRGAEPSAAVAYARQWRALAEGVREADPSALIVGGSITLEDDPGAWLQEIIASDPGLLALCDVVSYHNYSADPEVIERLTGRLRRALEDLGKPMPIWDTEWAPVKTPQPFYRDAPRNLSLDSTSARRTAALLVQGHVARIGAGVARSFVYHGYSSASMSRYEYDLLSELGGAPRPTVPAQAVLATMLTGCTFERREPMDGLWAYRFVDQKENPLLIVWRKADQAPAEIDLPGSWLPIDMMGNPLATRPTSRLLIGHEPVYLRGSSAAP